MSEEIWSVIDSMGGEYAVSNLGRVKGLERVITHPYTKTRRIKERILSPSRNPGGHLFIATGKYRKQYVHRLVAQAFIPNPDNLPIVRHLDDNPKNNHVENLAWGTQSDNMFDAARNGLNHETKKTHCPRGHPYDEENTYLIVSKKGSNTAKRRECRECKSASSVKYRQIRGTLEPDDPRHGTYTGYCNWNCRCAPCKEAKKIYRRKQEAKYE